MLGVYNYTVILTYLGMLAGFAGITFAMDGNPHAALICLMISGVCDMFDGKIASTMERTKQEQRFGVQIDSLSDLICFGLLPALIVYQSAKANRLALFISALYVLCALIRLAWFNVDEEERQDREMTHRAVYYGLPVTTAALIFPALFGICGIMGSSFDGAGSVCMLVTACAFLLPFRLRKPALIGKIGILFAGVAGLGLLLAGGAL